MEYHSFFKTKLLEGSREVSLFYVNKQKNVDKGNYISFILYMSRLWGEEEAFCVPLHLGHDFHYCKVQISRGRYFYNQEWGHRRSGRRLIRRAAFQKWIKRHEKCIRVAGVLF